MMVLFYQFDTSCKCSSEFPDVLLRQQTKEYQSKKKFKWDRKKYLKNNAGYTPQKIATEKQITFLKLFEKKKSWAVFPLVVHLATYSSTI